MTFTQSQLTEGNVAPLGATITEQGCNFSIYCPDAESVYLCLFSDDEKTETKIQLKERIQSRWFGFIPKVKAGQLYAYRVKPKVSNKCHNEMSTSKVLIDPYGRQINRPIMWEKSLYEGDSNKLIPKCVVTKPTKPASKFNKVKASERIIYEAHVKGLSMLHPDVPENLKGTYLGASHPTILAHLQSLGVTAIQFLPFMAFMPEPFITEKGLTNYWGYNPVNYFCAEPRYAEKNAYAECKQMIAEYHAAGFEVISDVVFNHTAESGDDGPIISFKGLFNKHAYIQLENDENCASHVNYSGCGNTIKCSDPFTQNMIIDAMRHWVTEFGVDGFRFDLAATLGRETIDFRRDATLFKLIKQDPILKDIVTIAEPWDIGPGGYQLGQFPDFWLEVNDRFRDCVRGFWRGDEGLKGEFATRFMGSKDKFPKGMRPMQSSVNHITYHDGFTLQDIVSYEQKHNIANLEDNRDGHNHNLSANYGVEGPTTDVDIIRIREQQKRNLFATLLLSQGTPHILGGDELSRTQFGNNNAYCQDNEMSWQNWILNDTEALFLNYCKHVIGLRNKYPLIQEMLFQDDNFTSSVNVRTIYWYRMDGSKKIAEDWKNDDHHSFAMHIHAHVKGKDEEWVFCVNSGNRDTECNLPILLDNASWECLLHTAMENSDDYNLVSISPLMLLQAKTFCVFKK